MGSPYTPVDVTNYNANPPADDGSVTEANRIKWSTIKTKITDPLNTAIAAIDDNVATAFGLIDAGVLSAVASYQVLAADQGKLIRAAASGITFTTPDAASVGAPFVFGFLNDSTGNITLDGSGSQTIDGDATVTVPAGNGGRLRTDGTNWFTEGQNFQPTNLSEAQGYLSGLTLSTAGSSATFSVAAGVANDAAAGGFMTLAAAISKTTSAWAVGTGNGGLDTGTIANSTWYHAWLIRRTDTGVEDVLVSLSATAPTMPTNYTQKRRIGSMKTNGSGQWTTFAQVGDRFTWNVSVADVNAVALSVNRANKTLTVPTGVVVKALFRASINTSGTTALMFVSGDESDQVPAAGGLADLTVIGAGYAAGSFGVLTNTSAVIATRADSTAGTYSIFTYGWEDARGK